MECALLTAMLSPITDEEVKFVDDETSLHREAERLQELITAWLYATGIGFKMPETIQKLVKAIQDEGFRVD
jgi:hypothetical protein